MNWVYCLQPVGVIFSYVENSSYVIAGELMYPISWREMKCPKTGEVEERKTAKPV